MGCLDCCFRTVRWIPVVFIVAVIGWSYYAYVFELLVEAIPDNLIGVKVILGLFYHFFLFMFLWSYYKIAYTEPSGPPIKFYLTEASLNNIHRAEMSEDKEQIGKVLEECVKGLPVKTRTHNQGVRYCDICKALKPDRAHHCSVCRKCVLKMDHHCPWVNNCVSFINYKFFILFLFYAEIYCLYVAFSDLHFFIQFWTGIGSTGTGGMNFHVMFLFIVSLMFALSVIGLLGYHLYLVCRNQTTLESFRPVTFRGIGPEKRGYDIGRAGNWREVFGDNWKLWFIPVITAKGDGVEYPTKANMRSFSYNTMNEQSRLDDYENKY